MKVQPRTYCYIIFVWKKILGKFNGKVGKLRNIKKLFCMFIAYDIVIEKIRGVKWEYRSGKLAKFGKSYRWNHKINCFPHLQKNLNKSVYTKFIFRLKKYVGINKSKNKTSIKKSTSAKKKPALFLSKCVFTHKC